jgi:hypothetical protein
VKDIHGKEIREGDILTWKWKDGRGFTSKLVQKKEGRIWTVGAESNSFPISDWDIKEFRKEIWHEEETGRVLGL